MKLIQKHGIKPLFKILIFVTHLQKTKCILFVRYVIQEIHTPEFNADISYYSSRWLLVNDWLATNQRLVVMNTSTAEMEKTVTVIVIIDLKY